MGQEVHLIQWPNRLPNRRKREKGTGGGGFDYHRSCLNTWGAPKMHTTLSFKGVKGAKGSKVVVAYEVLRGMEVRGELTVLLRPFELFSFNELF